MLEWPASAERRAHRRVPLGAGVLVGDRIAMGLDVSAGGVALRWPDELALAGDVNVVIRLPGAGTVRAPATVVWSAEGRAAVRFLHLDPRGLAALMRFVSFGGLL